MSNRFAGVRAKIEWAEHHVRDLKDRIAAFRERNPNLLLCQQDPQTDDRVFRLRESLPPELPLITGDALHNLRSSLDLLARQLVEANGINPDRTTAFPIFKAPPEKESVFAGKVKGMHPDVVSLVKSVQPYVSGDNSLWVISELDNIDKHRLLLVVAYGVHSFGFSYTNHELLATLDPTTRARVDDFKRGAYAPTPAGPGGIITPSCQLGVELARISWDDGPPSRMDENLHLAYEVAIVEPKVVDRQPVVPLLTRLTQFVKNIADQFERLL